MKESINAILEGLSVSRLNETGKIYKSVEEFDKDKQDFEKGDIISFVEDCFYGESGDQKGDEVLTKALKDGIVKRVRTDKVFNREDALAIVKGSKATIVGPLKGGNSGYVLDFGSVTLGFNYLSKTFGEEKITVTKGK